MTRRSEWADVLARGKRDDAGCLVWTGSKNRKGYGTLSYHGSHWLVHRLAWVQTHGPIPDELDVDHTCSNRACFDIAHLEAVPHAENVRRSKERRTHCKAGHALTPDNVEPGTLRRQGARRCATCYEAYLAERRVGAPARGESHGASKLTERDVRSIRSRVAAGERIKDVAAAYPISESSVSRIVKKKAWAHVL